MNQCAGSLHPCMYRHSRSLKSFNVQGMCHLQDRQIDYSSAVYDPTHVNPQLETDCTAKLHKDSFRFRGHALWIYYW